MLLELTVQSLCQQDTSPPRPALPNTKVTSAFSLHQFPPLGHHHFSQLSLSSDLKVKDSESKAKLL